MEYESGLTAPKSNHNLMELFATGSAQTPRGDFTKTEGQSLFVHALGSVSILTWSNTGRSHRNKVERNLVNLHIYSINSKQRHVIKTSTKGVIKNMICFVSKVAQ